MIIFYKIKYLVIMIKTNKRLSRKAQPLAVL